MKTVTKLCLAFIIATSATAQEDVKPDGESIETSPVGDTSFDVADRLAIMNLIHSYGYFSDEARTDDWLALFTESATMEGWHDGKKFVDGLSLIARFARSQRKVMEKENIQMRHVLSAPRFDRQTTNEAVGQVYFQLFRTKDEKPSLVTTGVYEFTAVKQDGQWKIDRWVGILDSPLV